MENSKLKDITFTDASDVHSFVDSLIFRIEGKYYDLTNFSKVHPGGRNILVWAKRKAWDHTQMFSTHHVNYRRATAIMTRFELKDERIIERIQALEALEVPQRFPYQLPHSSSKHYPVALKGSGIEARYDYPVYHNGDDKRYTSEWSIDDLRMADCTFELPQKGSFYYELRDEVYKHFKQHNIDYYPTTFYMSFWWATAIALLASQALQYYFRSYLLAVFTGLCYLVLGGYGHQFIHNPVKFRHYAYLSLDWMGLYSYTYMMDHIAVHHIYTNTIPDNHFAGTDPFLYVNPFMPRNACRKSFNFVLSNLTVALGIFGNYIINWVNIVAGREHFYWCIFLFPLNYALMCILVGDVSLGLKLSMMPTMLCSWWYFTIALMNHNQSENWNMAKLTAAAQSNTKNGGWAEMQLVTSSDIGYNYGFVGSMMCLWLNYHTVHHLLPTVDMSHHKDAQQILNRVAAKHGLAYSYKPVSEMYWDMLSTFSVAKALTVMMDN
eukprot:CAMPEP_0202696188 /NCGR_PEP_ID=MMETSP1385-20130828/9501_1 /ASSEMBLY_ACC=CAM_ASM_000861 /TAXON_ID=933848 /ORGANISM="Elphidium margaritaceum" /LENGTH=492 /DNA_ID=CAMNT_0049352301 /DNA_START=100 /DNA_END=1578 /DNA_ORIENTATION=-